MKSTNMVKITEYKYKADDNKIIKTNKGIYIGKVIDLSSGDSIENYKEVKLTKANDVEGLLKIKK